METRLLGIWLLIQLERKVKNVLKIPQKCQNNKEMQRKKHQKKLKMAMKRAKHHLKHLYHSPIGARGSYPSLIPEYTYQNTENVAKLPYNDKKNSITIIYVTDTPKTLM